MEWSILQLDCYPANNTVITVHWRVFMSDGAYTATFCGATEIALDESVPFVPYPDLTEPQVIEWVKSALTEDGVRAVEQILLDDLRNQATPSVVAPPLPWVG